MSIATIKRTAGVVLVAALAFGGSAAAAQAAAATPVSSAGHQQAVRHAGKVQVIKKAVKWIREQTVSGGIQILITEGIASLKFESSPTAAEASERFWASVPLVSANNLTTPSSLVTFAKLAPGGTPTSRSAFVRSEDPRALFNKVTSGGVKSGANQYKVGTQTVTFRPGTKSTPPTIKISNTTTSTTITVIR
ncbi:hypothetical protein GS489_06735 [Rhodococcus hoagii]|nr:hypothetical protein [Prescottella equi]MBM4570110.1 hypothetical protein [Prescottella equi]MBM4570117.1 hypothetical protein [Prescottella equi]